MEARVRLRPWLESRLDQGWIDGLCWIDKEKGIFKIPWKHHSKHTWTEEDAAIFKDWAVVTGRFRPGVDEPDWPMWKTRLRCALNKAPDIQEVKQRHDLHCDEPFKVYRFISRTESLWRANATRNACMIFDGIAYANKLNCSQLSTFPGGTECSFPPVISGSKRTAVFLQRRLGMEGNMKSVTLLQRRMDGIVIRRLPVVQPRYFINQQYCGNAATQGGRFVNTQNPDVDDPVVCASWRSVTESSVSAPTSVLQRLGVLSNSPTLAGYLNPPYPPDLLEPEYHQLGIRIQHLGIRVRDTIITNPNGCCIYFGRFDEIDSLAAPEPVETQIPHHVSEANKDYVDLLLENMVRGIVLSVVQGSIYAERMCKCAVFVYVPTPSGDHILLKKLGRRERELIFDYNQFMDDLLRFREGERAKPHFEVILAFGQQIRPNLTCSSLLVWCRVASCRAWFQIHKNYPGLSLSDGDNGDYIHEDFGHASNVAEPPVKGSRSEQEWDNRPRFIIVSNKSNTCGSVDFAGKMDRVADLPQSDSATMRFEESPQHDLIEEQVIEEAVEIPLDDHERGLSYDASGDQFQTYGMVPVSCGPDTTDNLSVGHELLIDESDCGSLKPDTLTSVDDTMM